MAKMSCFPALLAGRRKKHRKVAGATKAADCPKVKPVEFIQAPLADVVVAGELRDAKVTVPVAVAAPPKGGDQQGEVASVMSDADFEFPVAKKPVGSDDSGGGGAEKVESPAEQDTPPEPTDATQKLKRSCSNIETKRPGPRDDATAAVPPPTRRSRSYSDLTDLHVALAAEMTMRTPRERGEAQDPEASPASVKTSRTADRVMLKKRSSSQVLPSRSRKLWWRLFLWSHRNLHRPQSSARASASAAAACSAGRHGGYTSDTHEEGGPADDHRKDKMAMADGSTPPAVPNQWVAFCAENSLHDRVSAWVSSIETEPPFGIAEVDDEVDADDNEEGACTARHRALKLGEPSSSGMKGHGRSKRCTAADEASSVVQSLNAFSMVAHISGMGLKVVPMIAPFSSLRAVNLSGNFIVHISSGSLPKGLHSLDLSRNRIAAIEGLRELTKLRVLNLCYNRISRIGHGLSNCTTIRELYLAGNKISDVEGLHRLLKLAVLDLSFNKITMAKALGQLVANYHSLLALNLVGNPVQTNIGDDALRRAVTGLLPGLAYLNKQPVKPQRSAREVATDSVARAALGGGGGGGRSQRRRASRRMGAGAVVDGGGRSRSRGRHHGSGSGSTKK